jgi:energy-coupling factor transport system ATP-binding protein
LPKTPAITCQNVNYTYRSQGRNTHALVDVNLTIAQGAFCGIAGHTGSGKSTLLALLCALTKPTSGKIVISGLDLAERKSRRALHTKVGLALQYPEHQLFAPTVAQDVAYGLVNAGVVEPKLTERVRGAMAAMGLAYEQYAQRSPLELSGGEKRRVALAGVLATQPSVLLLDEPTAGLDPQGRAEILSYIKAVNASGVTVVMVSHSMNDLAELCTQVVVIKDGRIVLDDTPACVFDPQTNSALLRELNLELPQTVSFIETLRAKSSIFADMPSAVFNIDELADAISSQLGCSCQNLTPNPKVGEQNGD